MTNSCWNPTIRARPATGGPAKRRPTLPTSSPTQSVPNNDTIRLSIRITDLTAALLLRLDVPGGRIPVAIDSCNGRPTPVSLNLSTTTACWARATLMCWAEACSATWANTGLTIRILVLDSSLRRHRHKSHFGHTSRSIRLASHRHSNWAISLRRSRPSSRTSRPATTTFPNAIRPPSSTMTSFPTFVTSLTSTKTTATDLFIHKTVVDEKRRRTRRRDMPLCVFIILSPFSAIMELILSNNLPKWVDETTTVADELVPDRNPQCDRHRRRHSTVTTRSISETNPALAVLGATIFPHCPFFFLISTCSLSVFLFYTELIMETRKQNIILINYRHTFHCVVPVS